MTFLGWSTTAGNWSNERQPWLFLSSGAPLGFQHSGGAGGEVGEFADWADRPGSEVSAAVLTCPGHLLRAGRAKGALECAYGGLSRVWGQVPVAAFAIWAQIK